MVRQKLEKVDVRGDIQAFIASSGTGTEKPGELCLLSFNFLSDIATQLTSDLEEHGPVIIEHVQIVSC